jgi:hypothetical protein
MPVSDVGSRKPFDFSRFHVIYPAAPGGLFRLPISLIAEN